MAIFALLVLVPLFLLCVVVTAFAWRNKAVMLTTWGLSLAFSLWLTIHVFQHPGY